MDGMQTQNPFLDELAKLTTAAMGLALAFLTSVVGMFVPAIASLVGSLVHFLSRTQGHREESA